jgi:hypothetical protein
VSDAQKPKWVTVAVAAALMDLSERQARRRLKQLDADLDGRLLKAIGTKAMPSGNQPSKYLICLPVLRAAMDAETDDSAAIVELRAEVTLMRHKLEALRKAVRPLLAKRTPRQA